MIVNVKELRCVLDSCDPEDRVLILVDGNDIATETMPAVNAVCIKAIADGESDCLLIVAEG